MLNIYWVRPTDEIMYTVHAAIQFDYTHNAYHSRSTVGHVVSVVVAVCTEVHTAGDSRERPLVSIA